MRKLILIKHSSPQVTPGVPPSQWPLSERGRELCTPVAEKVAAYAPSVIVASEEIKASETGQRIADRLNVQIETAPGLQEHDRDNVPHLRSAEFISLMELAFRKPDDLVLGRETANQSERRFAGAIEAVLAKHPTGNIAVVSHGTVIALFVAKHSGQKPFELWRKLGLPSLVAMSASDWSITDVVARIESR